MQSESWGPAWLLLCLSFAANILDDAVNDFLGYYNATVLTLYGHFSWFPRVDLSFRCLAPDFLDSELSVFMQRLRAQGAAGEPGQA